MDVDTDSNDGPTFEQMFQNLASPNSKQQDQTIMDDFKKMRLVITPDDEPDTIVGNPEIRIKVIQAFQNKKLHKELRWRGLILAG